MTASTRIKDILETRDAVMGAASVLRRAHAEKTGGFLASLDSTRVQEALEDLAEQGLAKKADIDTAVQRISSNPNTILDVLRNIGTIAVRARTAVAGTIGHEGLEPAEQPGTFAPEKVSKGLRVTKKASSDMSSRFREVQQKIDEKVRRRRGA